jgi:hypothetical protein
MHIHLLLCTQNQENKVKFANSSFIFYSINYKPTCKDQEIFLSKNNIICWII